MYLINGLLLLTLLLSCTSIQKNSTGQSALDKNADPYLWLEEIQGERQLNWAKEQNALTFSALQTDKRYSETNKILEVEYSRRDKIPSFVIRKELYYNFWTDADHLRGLYRRTTAKEYQKFRPKWETLIDFDLISKEEKKSWVYKGAHAYQLNQDKLMITLSEGGKDAVVLREFDSKERRFVSEGFQTTAEAKTHLTWFDDNTLLIGQSNDKEGQTTSGYPKVIRLWKRGTPLADAPIIFKGDESDMSISADVDYDSPKKTILITKTLDFYHADSYLLIDGKQIKLGIPSDAQIEDFTDDHLLLNLKTDWTVQNKLFTAGSLLFITLEQHNVTEQSKITSLFTPTEKVILESTSVTKQGLLLKVLSDVNSEVWHLTFKRGNWKKEIVGLPKFQDASVSFSSKRSNESTFLVDGFLNPPTYYLFNLEKRSLKKIKSTPSRFNTEPFVVNQFFATSKDGTKIPYFIVNKKEITFNGNNPTLIRAYGGFEVSELPYYSAGQGRTWLQKGGVLVVANLRGGGEYGPKWHLSAIKENRQKVFDDLAAVAEDLIAKKVTSPRRLAIQGGSNGGLLVATVMSQRPNLFNAVVCQVPLIDMLRYHKLLAGFSWVGEYGNPDLQPDRDWLIKYSPYQNIKTGVRYPKILIMTSTLDDRVHPGHARKFAARLKEFGSNVLYYENIEGGHGGAADWKQSALSSSLSTTFLYQQLFD